MILSVALKNHSWFYNDYLSKTRMARMARMGRMGRMAHMVRMVRMARNYFDIERKARQTRMARTARRPVNFWIWRGRRVRRVCRGRRVGAKDACD